MIDAKWQSSEMLSVARGSSSSETVADGETKVEPIKGPEVGSRF